VRHYGALFDAHFGGKFKLLVPLARRTKLVKMGAPGRNNDE
jgi:hypothetical protein